ncbi:GNAT family acetyltransferase [Halobacteriales archaeon QH_6_66_25]|nr:MAG: GNAT family acetyltransferase [Halobacteriales archaeon QH_6_66_25]
MQSVTGPGGQTLFVDRTEGKRGAKGPFHVVYADERGQQRWGFFCTNCETVKNAVDSMGRVQCNVCSNRTKAEEWDAAHE